MPSLPAQYDSNTLQKYFEMIDVMDPKGGRLAHEVSDFADNLA